MFIEQDKNKQNALEAAGHFGLDGEHDDDDPEFINAKMAYANGSITAGGAGINGQGNHYDSVAAARSYMQMKEQGQNPSVMHK